MSLATGTRLGPYEIVSPIGAGGMGEVYKARDTRLDRDVAIKVIGAGSAADPIAHQRLLREARAASALNHPHICTIYDIGDDGGRPFIAMEWLDGESLADRLARRSGALPVDDVVRLAAQVADGLDAAHRSGVIHRDLKPANLFVTSRGDAKILDFGLAKIAAEARDFNPAAATVAAERQLTTPGSAVGTISYMSPEQARGDPLDVRSDLFSFGVVLYEMATGRAAFAAPTTALTFDAILNRQPAPPRDVNRDVPPALDQIIFRLLAKDPSNRPPSARAVLDDLAALRESRQRDRSSGSARIAPSLAVLPFTNLSPDPENEYIADGITEEIINALTQLKGLQVAARTSSFAFKGKTPDIADVAAKLRVAHVLTGSVRKAGQRLRITAQLVSAADGFPLWSERYDRQADDIFEIQDEIATAIAQKLRLSLATPADEPVVKRPTDNLAAYELYLKGRFFVNQRGAAVLRGLECFEQALRLDSSYALAHAGIASALALLGFTGYVPGYEALPNARRAALTAIDLDPLLAEPYPPLMLVTWAHDWDWARAEREFRRAVALDDRLESAYMWHALHLAGAHGRFDEAIQAGTRAIEIDPLSAANLAALASCYIYAGLFDEAEAASRRALELAPTLWSAERFLGDALRHSGRTEEAVEHLTRAVALSDRHHWPIQELAHLLLSIGRSDEARRLCEELIDRVRTRYVPPMSIGYAFGLLDRGDEAFEWLERAYRERDALPLWKHWPYAIGTNDPRRAAIFRRMGLQS
jgi:serine/threonine protein kinase/Flp pilus assembly protein TadD